MWGLRVQIQCMWLLRDFSMRLTKTYLWPLLSRCSILKKLKYGALTEIRWICQLWKTFISPFILIWNSPSKFSSSLSNVLMFCRREREKERERNGERWDWSYKQPFVSQDKNNNNNHQVISRGCDKAEHRYTAEEAARLLWALRTGDDRCVCITGT